MDIISGAYVAFINVIGFKSLVKDKNKENQIRLVKLFETIKVIFKKWDTEKKTLLKMILSDSIILVAKPDLGENKDNFKMILLAVRNLQSWLAMEGFWVRGAISVGDIVYDNAINLSIIYGDGDIRAYELEKKAIYP